MGPIQYFNGVTFFETFDSDTTMALYWTMAVLAFVPFFGTPIIHLITIYMTTAVNLNTFV